VLIAQIGRQALVDGTALTFANAESLSDPGGYQQWVNRRGEIDKDSTMPKMAGQLSSYLQSQARLADTRRAGERKQAHILSQQERYSNRNVLLSTYE
jgi:hypothetical protein